MLTFTHPSAGRQFVKGTIEKGEKSQEAAERELFEESGLRVRSSMIFIGTQEIGIERVPWHFFAYRNSSLPDTWTHVTEDDDGHSFSFFWHSVQRPLDQQWHPIFHEAFTFFVPRVLLLV
ncbi:NUDIX domain-containing protein [Agrobacterium sp. BA1120]|uniref:NUDIX domain-containing protein n=1 Tax=Agrobacterium sp. BA1120 TaxID=3228927 RepID=UPI00336A77E2